jgi:hypothetical protein
MLGRSPEVWEHPWIPLPPENTLLWGSPHNKGNVNRNLPRDASKLRKKEFTAWNLEEARVGCGSGQNAF